MKMRLTIIFAFMPISTSLACWRPVPLKELIQESHVVVIGEITSITVAAPPQEEKQYQFDFGEITIQEVLFNTLTNKPLKPNQKLSLSMPSIRNRLQISTDIRYEVGKRGICNTPVILRSL